MASPHVAGVAALVVGQYGRADRRNGGLKMDPDKVERILLDTATNTPCPEPREFHYPEDTGGTYDATCEGSRDRNGFYGEGIVNANAAVRGRR
jgi:subtilisin family serine protease